MRMMMHLTSYRIENTRSGVIIGVYQGRTPREALDAFARDAGYDDYDHACEVAPVRDDEIVCIEVDTGGQP